MSKQSHPKHRYLALIPARGGSKRLPGKNVLPLAGKPLIQWTIEAALESKLFDHVLVSTDDAKIRDLALKSQAQVPFLRPEALSSDKATSVDVAIHALDYLSQQGQKFDYLVLLQPTSPLRKASDIQAAIELLETKRADAVISVCASEHPPQWMNTLPEDLSMDHFMSQQVINQRSQDLGQYYQLNGAIFIVSVDALCKQKTFFANKSYAYIMPRERSIDIDTAFDFRLTELMLLQA